MRLQLLADYAVYLVVRLLICLVQALPLSTCQRLARLFAYVTGSLLRLRGGVVDDNLRHAFPELSAAERRALTLRMWEHLYLMVVEIAHAPRKIHDTNWRDYITFEKTAEMLLRLWDERPVVFLSAHHGNFELAGYTMGLFGFPTFTVARPIENRFIDRYVNEFRGSKGTTILPKTGSAAAVDRLLAAGSTLSVLCDQHAGPKGTFVEFFGRPASTHKSIALFSIANDAPLMVSFALRQQAPLHYLVGTEAIIDPRDGGSAGDVPGLTQQYTRVLEALIRRAPEQYWWVHRRWKDTRPARKSARAAAA